MDKVSAERVVPEASKVRVNLSESARTVWKKLTKKAAKKKRVNGVFIVWIVDGVSGKVEVGP